MRKEAKPMREIHEIQEQIYEEQRQMTDKEKIEAIHREDEEARPPLLCQQTAEEMSETSFTLFLIFRLYLFLASSSSLWIASIFSLSDICLCSS